jgi:hypothetical protein
MKKFDHNIGLLKNANFFAENCQKWQKIVILTSTPKKARQCASEAIIESFESQFRRSQKRIWKVQLSAACFQGDRIGRFFAHWAAVNYEHFFYYRRSPHYWATWFNGEGHNF